MAAIAEKSPEVGNGQVRKRHASPASRKDVAEPKAKAKSALGSADKNEPKKTSMLDVVEGFPPQLCALALGSAGLSRAWLLGGPASNVLPRLWCLVAGGFLGIYGMKAALRPKAFLGDVAQPATLAALSAAPATMQVLTLRLKNEEIIDLLTTQCAILLCHLLLLFTATRFALLNVRKGLWPDPSWFPGLLLFGMTNISASVVGPEWLKALTPFSFWLTIVIYIPLKLVVIYRLFVWKMRKTVTPNAAMATFMAPASFFTVVHLSMGKPGGDLMGLLLFADSTISFLVTLVLLWVRRSLWATNFHPSYVAFTFPLASTATGALLAQVHLPSVASPLLELYSKILLYVSTSVILAVQLRFMYFLVELQRKQK